MSQRIRKRIEEVFGWCKTVGGLAGRDASAGGSSDNRAKLRSQRTIS